MQHKSKPSLSFFMPAYNEEDNIESAIKIALRVLKKITADFELIVVNDGSNDQTVKKVRRLKQEEKRIRLISHNTNHGYGNALRSGIQAAKKEYTFYTDADNQFDIQKLPELVSTLGEHKMIIGYRTWRQDSVHRQVMSWVYGNLIKFLFAIRVTDINCSFKLFPTSLYKRYPLQATTVFIDAEMVIRAQQANLTIIEVPVTHYSRIYGKSKFELGKKGVMMVIHPRRVFEILFEIFSLYPSLTTFSSTAKIDKPNGKRTASRK